MKLTRRQFLAGGTAIVGASIVGAKVSTPAAEPQLLGIDIGRPGGDRTVMVYSTPCGGDYLAIMHPSAERDFFRGRQWTPEQQAELAIRRHEPLKFNKIPVFGQFKRSKGVIVHG